MARGGQEQAHHLDRPGGRHSEPPFAGTRAEPARETLTSRFEFAHREAPCLPCGQLEKHRATPISGFPRRRPCPPPRSRPASGSVRPPPHASSQNRPPRRPIRGDVTPGQVNRPGFSGDYNR